MEQVAECCGTSKRGTHVLDVHEDALVCYCEEVSKKTILEAIAKGAKTVKDVVDATGACKSAAQCEELNPHKRCCAIDIMELLKETK